MNWIINFNWNYNERRTKKKNGELGDGYTYEGMVDKMFGHESVRVTVTFFKDNEQITTLNTYVPFNPEVEMFVSFPSKESLIKQLRKYGERSFDEDKLPETLKIELT